MVKLKDIAKPDEIVDMARCPRMKFDLDEELIRDAKSEIKKRKTDSIAIPADAFLKAFGRPVDDPTKPSSITYCINEHLRDPKKPYRKHGIRVGVHTDRKTGKRFFKFEMVNWDDWDAEHSRKEEE